MRAGLARSDVPCVPCTNLLRMSMLGLRATARTEQSLGMVLAPAERVVDASSCGGQSRLQQGHQALEPEKAENCCNGCEQCLECFARGFVRCMEISSTQLVDVWERRRHTTILKAPHVPRVYYGDKTSYDDEMPVVGPCRMLTGPTRTRVHRYRSE